MTYLGRFVTLTLGDLRSKTYQSIRLDERNTVVSKIIPLTSVVQKLLIKNISLKNVILTFDDLWCIHY